MAKANAFGFNTHKVAGEAKSKVKSAGKTAFTVLSVIADASTQVRINEIDEEIKKLQEERTELESRLINRD